MSLRARLTASVALLAVGAVVAFGVIGYVSTRDRLRAEIDRSLRGAARPFLDADGHGSGDPCDGLTKPNRVFGEEQAESLGPHVQCLSRSGTRTARNSELAIPIHPSDARLAQSVGSASFITETIDQTSYRVLTTSRSMGGAVQAGRSLAETDRVLDSLRDRYLLVGSFVIALAAIAGWLIARRTSRPLVLLTRAAERVTATGVLNADVSMGRRDEVGRLAREFATMMDALNESKAQQQRLAQDAGHELRTPLTSLRTNIETLRRHRDLANDARDHVLDDLESESHELSTLVDELVELVTDQTDDQEERRVDLSPIVMRSVERTQRRSGRTLHASVEPSVVLGRPRQLQRAIANLFDNAMKFSPDDTPVEVDLRRGVLTVRDHGPGIAVVDLPHVFDRFYRSDRARGLPGSGLGLAIVRQVSEEHGGSIDISNAPGGGTIATLVLPLVGAGGLPPDAVSPGH